MQAPVGECLRGTQRSERGRPASVAIAEIWSPLFQRVSSAFRRSGPRCLARMAKMLNVKSRPFERDQIDDAAATGNFSRD